MSWVAAAIGGGAVLSTIAGGRAADRAAAGQSAAARDANATQLEMYNQTRNDFANYRRQGSDALSSLARDNFMKDYQQDPGYQNRMQEGMRALESSAAARGGLNSGATMK